MEREPKLEISIGALPLEPREPHGRGGARNVGARRAQGISRAWPTDFNWEVAIIKPAWVCVRSSAYMIWLLVWCFGGTPDSGSGPVSGPLVCSWEPFIPAGSPRPALMKGFVLSLVVYCYVMFSGCPWRPALFWGEGEWWIWKRGEIEG